MAAFCLDPACFGEVVKVLVGETNPSGSLPISLLSSKNQVFGSDTLVEESSGIAAWNSLNQEANFLISSPFLPLGFGLSYSIFDLKNLQVNFVPIGDISHLQTATSQSVPCVNITFTIELIDGPPGKV